VTALAAALGGVVGISTQLGKALAAMRAIVAELYCYLAEGT
jgi:hypothetical protein